MVAPWGSGSVWLPTPAVIALVTVTVPLGLDWSAMESNLYEFDIWERTVSASGEGLPTKPVRPDSGAIWVAEGLVRHL